MKTKPDRFVRERLSRSQIFRNYERAFGEATGLPLTLAPTEDWHLAHHGCRHEAPFCALLAGQNKSCAACLCVQHELAAETTSDARTTTCFAGLRETAVPVRIGDRVIGLLRTGGVLLEKPRAAQFARVAKLLRDWELGGRVEEFKTTFFQTRVLSAKHYNSIVQLLRIFAEHLSLVANQIAFQSEHVEPPTITRARRFIDEHKGEDLSLKQVASAANMSRFYFCKKFHQAVGCTFTEYLARVRVEAAKAMLLNPNTRVSEVAFEAGFQSITHFNRVFRNLAGRSPTDYRAALPKAA